MLSPCLWTRGGDAQCPLSPARGALHAHAAGVGAAADTQACQQVTRLRAHLAGFSDLPTQAALGAGGEG